MESKIEFTLTQSQYDLMDTKPNEFDNELTTSLDGYRPMLLVDNYSEEQQVMIFNPKLFKELAGSPPYMNYGEELTTEMLTKRLGNLDHYDGVIVTAGLRVIKVTFNITKDDSLICNMPYLIK